MVVHLYPFITIIKHFDNMYGRAGRRRALLCFYEGAILLVFTTGIPYNDIYYWNSRALAGIFDLAYRFLLFRI